MRSRTMLALMAVFGFCVVATACTSMPVGNRSVPEPSKPVDLKRYSGVWYEYGRYENRFEKNCQGVTAQYKPKDDGSVEVINTCHKDTPAGPVKIAHGNAKLVGGSGGAKLKVSFFGPFYFGNYWVLDHADDYGWSIVGEPSGKYLWLLTRDAVPSDEVRKVIEGRTRALGYDYTLVRLTAH